MDVLYGRAEIRKMEVKFPLPSTKTGGFLLSPVVVSQERPGLSWTPLCSTSWSLGHTLFEVEVTKKQNPQASL